ncbi:MAG: hypothetical protein ACOYEN_01370 [Limnochordia bacterium]|jgi:hypothetical protein
MAGLRRLFIPTILVSVLLLLSGCFLLSSPEDDQSLPLIHKQDFETTPIGQLPSGWEILNFHDSPDEPSVVDAPVALGEGNRVLCIERTASSPNISGQATYCFTPVSRKLRLTFKMWNTSDLRSLRVSLGGTVGNPGEIHNSFSKTAIFLITAGEKLRILKDAKHNEWIDVGDYTPNQWYTVTLEIDIGTQTFDVYVDHSEVPGNETPLSFYNENPDLNTVAFGYQHASNTAPVYIDDVEIWGK